MGLIFKEISGYVYDSISVDRLVVFCMKIRNPLLMSYLQGYWEGKQQLHTRNHFFIMMETSDNRYILPRYCN